MQNFNNFGVEKYLKQLNNNPYIEELKADLKNEKNNYLKLYLNHKILNLLNQNQEKVIINLNKENLEKISIELNSITENHEININLIVDKFKQITSILKPTPLRISTMTACCNLGCEINTKYLYNVFSPPRKEDLFNPIKSKKKYNPNLKELIIGCKAEDFDSKGYFEKQKKSNFFNSAALNLLIYDNKCINIKVFNNGKLQMTGVPSEDYGKKAANIVINYLKNIPDGKEKIVENKDKLNLVSYKTVLINSDYFCGTELKRENLNQILQDRYELSVNYESENYPGVKLEYFWNKLYLNTENEGKCVCEKKCIGKGSGNGIGECKKITISSFQSGKVIVTGGRSLEQLNDAYKFINNIFKESYDFIKKTNINNIKSNKNIFIKKSNITNFHIYNSLVNSVQI